MEPVHVPPGSIEAPTRGIEAIALDLRARGHDPSRVARFLERLVFCFFAEDPGLLPDRAFRRVLEASRDCPDSCTDRVRGVLAEPERYGLSGPFAILGIDGTGRDDRAYFPLSDGHVRILLELAQRD